MKSPGRPAFVTRSMGPSSVTAPSTERTSVPDPRHSFSSQATGTHRLHPSRQRRPSDASIEKPLSGSSRKPPPKSPRESGPPPSTRGFSAVPPTASVPSLSRPSDASHGLQSYSSMASSSSSLASNDSTASSLRTTSYHSRKTPSSSVSSAGSSNSYKAPQPTGVSPAAASEFVFPFSNESTSAEERDSSPAGIVTPTPKTEAKEPEQTTTPRSGSIDPQTRPFPYPTTNTHPLPTVPRPKSYYPPKVARFTENVTEIPPEPRPRPTRPINWLTRRFSQTSCLSVDEVPELQPAEPGSIAEAAERANAKKEHEKAKPAKLLKKNRWSIGPRVR